MKSSGVPKALVIGGSWAGCSPPRRYARLVGRSIFTSDPLRRWIVVAGASFCKRTSCTIFVMRAFIRQERSASGPMIVSIWIERVASCIKSRCRKPRRPGTHCTAHYFLHLLLSIITVARRWWI